MEKSMAGLDMEWEEISGRVRTVLNYGIARKERLEKSKLARFIAAIPYLAGCEKPRETSFTNLLIYLVSLDESARDIYFHKPGDDRDIYSRLRPILNYTGGDRKILDCCRDLIALCMVANYRKDAEHDQAIGKYNPVAAGVWDGDALQKKLMNAVNTSITPEIAARYTAEDAVKGLWEA